MKRIIQLVLLFLFTLLAGCAGDAAESGPVQLAAAASTLPRAQGCGVTDAEIKAVKFGDYPEDTIEAARQEFFDAREANQKIDDRLKENLARVGAALSEAKIAAFTEAFETSGTVNGKKVGDVRARFAAATKKLATVLEAVDADEDIAWRASNQKLLAAYGDLARSPCPARAIRFAVVLFSLSPQSPYADLAKYEAEAHAVGLIYDALAGGVVEEGIAADSPDKGLEVVRGWVATASGQTGSLSSVLQNRDSLKKQVTGGGAPVKIKDTELTKPLAAVNGVLAIWNASEAIAEGDVLAILQTGPAGVEAVANAVAAIGRHFEWARVSDAAKVASAAAKVGMFVGAVFEAKAIIDLLVTLGEPNTDTHAALVELGGHALVLVGAFVPPPLGIALAFGGSVAILVSRFMRDPPPDELSPLLQVLVDKQMLSASEKSALAKARADNMFILKKKLALTEDEVLFTVARAPNAVAKEDALDYFEVLAKLGAQKKKTPAMMLKAIARSSDAEWGRFELETFFAHVQRGPALFRVDEARAIRADLVTVRDQRFVADFFRPKDFQRTDGKAITAEEMRTHARGAIDGVLGTIP